MSDIKIKTIAIRHFRGISKEINIDTSDKNNYYSYILYGDNGCGKSSIIDAIELATTGTFNRKGFLNSSISYNDAEEAEIIIELSDDSISSAGLKHVYDKEADKWKYERNLTRNKDFCYAPFILRRSDILTFWSTESQQRLRVFINVNNVSNSEGKKTAEISFFEQKYISLSSKRAELLKSLCEEFNIESTNVTRMDNFLEEYSKKYGEKFFSTRQEKKNFVLAKRVQEIEPKIKDVKHKLNIAKTNTVDVSKYAPLRKKLIGISNSITKAFIELSSNTQYVESISLEIGAQSEISLLFTAQLKNKQKINPQYVFSEANSDLLALLVYLEFLHSAETEGQAKVLVLDDVFQSVDSTIRFKVMQYILKRFDGWQFFITTHDRLWKEQIQQLFKTRNIPLRVSEIKTWSFEEGPVIVSSKNMYDEKLESAILNNSSVEICAAAGYLIEYICENLSWILRISIQRKYGDKYTIGDLWPGIYKICKKSAKKELFDNLNDLIMLRNLVGCHYNEWAMTLSQSEARDFGQAVLDVYKVVYNKEKGKWINSVEEIV